MVRFSRVRLAVCPMCHPQVIRSRWLRGYHGGDVLKYQESCEGFKTLPLNWVECGHFQQRCPPLPDIGVFITTWTWSPPPRRSLDSPAHLRPQTVIRIAADGIL